MSSPPAVSPPPIIRTTYNLPTYLLCTGVLLYILSLIVFAILRVVTGISIQRLGYLSLKRICLEPKDGIKLEVRKLGIVLHRPTFAQPTWVSLVIQDSHITLDLKKKEAEKKSNNVKSKPPPAPPAAPAASGRANRRNGMVLNGLTPPSMEDMKRSNDENSKKENKIAEAVEKLKTNLRKVHKWIKFIRLVDIMITNTTVTIADVGSIQIGSLTMAVDTRRGATNRNPMFDHCSDVKEGQWPIEWTIATKSILILTDKKQPTELLDHGTCNIYGVVEKDMAGIKDLAIAFKFGRVTAPVDELLKYSERLKSVRKKPDVEIPKFDPDLAHLRGAAFAAKRSKKVTELVMESKELVNSILRGVKEVQFAVGYLVVSKEAPNIQPAGKPLTISLGLKEFGLDIHQLDQKSPAHRMYFSSDDIAHQALLSTTSITISLNDGMRQDKILYIPMVTMTSKTTLFSKTIQIIESLDTDRNTNLLSANIVVTSPSVDLQPRHLPILVALLQSKPKKAPSPAGKQINLFSKLLPKASVKLIIQEPVARIVLPKNESIEDDDMDMLVSSLSSISLDLEAIHESENESQNRYALDAALRCSSHHLYYRAADGLRHDLLQTETFDLKVQLNASPEVQVVANAYLSTFCLRLARPEIVRGIDQMVSQIFSGYKPDKLRPGKIPSDKGNFLRKVPLWLEQVKLECNDFSIEVAGIDESISNVTRGAAFQVENWSVDYKIKRGDSNARPAPRRRATSRAMSRDNSKRFSTFINRDQIPSSHARNATDGRKLSFHLGCFEGYIIDGEDTCEADPFFQIPTFDLVFSTNNDAEGPLLKINSALKSINLNYSLFRHYSIVVAAQVIRSAFGGMKRPKAPTPADDQMISPLSTTAVNQWGEMEYMASPAPEATEFVSIDFTIGHIQIKGTMPEDPPIMIEIHQFEAGRHRWNFPFAKAKHVRFYAESPKVRDTWARLISLRNFRLDLREAKRRSEGKVTDEKSIDVSADAMRLAIPHQLTLYKVTDNIINSAKACQQLHHRFKTGSNEYLAEKGPEGPKQIPKISVKTKALLLELEDDPFETQLGMIYRVGLSEVKKRLAREAAFQAKVQKMQERNKRKSWENGPGGGRGRSKTSEGLRPAPNKPRSVSTNPIDRRKSMRYAPEEAAEMSENASVSIDDAWAKLQEHNSTAWIKRIRWVKEQSRSKIAEAREAFWGHDDMPTDTSESENILGLPMRPALMAAYFNDVSIGIGKPSFPLSELPKFMHRVGKGLPEDTLFSLLVPLGIKLAFGEAKVTLRDYPLPFVHIPPMRPGQRGHSWLLNADFVIGEEYWGKEATRTVQVGIIPPETIDDVEIPGFTIDVTRTVSAVKSYSDIKVDINTSYATRICWCIAYQPAIQDMMMVFETFSKPHVDPSERTGFWDKIRLILHSQVTLAWEGDGDIHLALKGSRDPYKLTGDGAGLVMCWRGDCRWELGREPDDPLKFLKVDSDEFVLAVPDFSNCVTDDLELGAIPDTKSINSANSYDNVTQFKKIIMKLSGRVRWLIGLMFEQEISFEADWKQRQRSFEFKPHYEVSLKSPEYVKTEPGEVYDSFRGFRSHHLHLSLSIVSPIEKDMSSPGSPPTSYNTIHLTPGFFTHFFNWIALFSGVMSLPVRQGDLWPGPEKSTKKFGRHLATIKYKLALAPLFISHIYKYHDKDDEGNSIVVATGLKTKLDALMLDIHMRKEESMVIPGSTTMKINQAEMDFHSADIRAVHAVSPGDTLNDIIEDDGMHFISDAIRYTGDISQFSITDGDYSWVDMDDFIELDWTQKNKTPKTSIMPLAFTPRFTYFRQTDHTDSNRISPFGYEESHDCIMSLNNDPREIQCALVQARLERVNEQMSKNKEAIDELAQRTKANPEDTKLRAESEMLIQRSSTLFNMRQFLQNMLRRISRKLDDGERDNDTELFNEESDSEPESEPSASDASPPADYASDFDNRFIVHNLQAKWSNPLRNIILKYIHQVGQRQGFVYYMSRRAVKFILDIIEEQKLNGRPQSSGRAEYSSSGPFSTDEPNDSATLQSRIEQLLNDDVKVVNANERSMYTPNLDEVATKLARNDLKGDVADEYVAENSYHVRLIAPQIQLQSDKNKTSAVLVAAQGMQLKIVSIMDRDRIGDDVSGLVQRRFALNLDNTQFFVSHHQDFAPHSMSLHSENRYGAPVGSSWPPWVPLESMFDFRSTPVGFSRVVERTSTTLRYDKHNSLRLKYSDQVSGLEAEQNETRAGPSEAERRVDHVWVDFPRVEATCDSSQYFALYIIVMDLLLYSEPAEKVRSEKLEKIMLASDFSDLTGAPEMVECLQSRIHQLTEIKSYFMLNAQELDLEGWEGKLAVERDLANCEEELFFMMKAITTAQRKYEDRNANASGVLRWYITASEIIWHMLKEKMEPMIDIRLKKAAYERVDNTDGSNLNTFEVEMVQGWNLTSNAVYPEMIGPFMDPSIPDTIGAHTKVLRVYWNMLEAIAGIPVMDHFEVNLVPLKIQLEREIGDKIFEYIFPEVGKDGTGDGISPFLAHAIKAAMPDDGDSDSEAEVEGPVFGEVIIDDSSSTKSDSVDLTNRMRTTPIVVTPEPQRPSSSSSELQRPKTSSAASFMTFKSSRMGTPKLLPAETFSHLTRRSTEGPNAGPAPSLLTPEKASKMKLFSRTNTMNSTTVEPPSDELSQMISRASSYMTLAYIKIPSVVLCLSYKGRGDKNIEDIHELVFKMPSLEYRNRTWSNLDLAMRLKKDIMKALLSHTGAIIQNKLTHHRPEKPAQSHLLRMMANNTALGTLGNRPGTSGGETGGKRPNTAVPGTESGSGSGLALNTTTTFGTRVDELSSPEEERLPPRRASNPADLMPSSNSGFSGLTRHLTNLSTMTRRDGPGTPEREGRAARAEAAWDGQIEGEEKFGLTTEIKAEQQESLRKKTKLLLQAKMGFSGLNYGGGNAQQGRQE